MKHNICHTNQTIQQFNKKIKDSGKLETPNTQIHDQTLHCNKTFKSYPILTRIPYFTLCLDSH